MVVVVGGGFRLHFGSFVLVFSLGLCLRILPLDRLVVPTRRLLTKVSILHSSRQSFMLWLFVASYSFLSTDDARAVGPKSIAEAALAGLVSHVPAARAAPTLSSRLAVAFLVSGHGKTAKS